MVRWDVEKRKEEREQWALIYSCSVSVSTVVGVGDLRLATKMALCRAKQRCCFKASFLFNNRILNDTLFGGDNTLSDVHLSIVN